MLKLPSGLTKISVLYFSILILSTSSVFTADRSLAPLETSLQNLISRLSQSVVTIEAAQSISQAVPSARSDGRVFNLIASGVIFDSAGHILVAASSVLNRESVLVMADGQKVSARLVGVDYQTGLALIKTERPVGRPVEALDNYRCVGQLIVAVGNSFGLHASPSLGFCAGARTDGSLQFSAAISSGSVGGGIFDLSGKLIGAITGGIGEGSQAEAGLAVPASELPEIVEYLQIHGDRQAGYLGVTISEIEVTPPIELRSLNILAGGNQHPHRLIDHSIIVTEVLPQTPAAFARVARGDLIISVDGDEVYSAVDFLYQIRRARPGSIVRLGLVRQNQLVMTNVVIGQRPNVSSDLQMSGLFENAYPQTPDASVEQELQALKKAMLRLEQRISDNK